MFFTSTAGVVVVDAAGGVTVSTADGVGRIVAAVVVGGGAGIAGVLSVDDGAIGESSDPPGTIVRSTIDKKE